MVKDHAKTWKKISGSNTRIEAETLKFERV